MTVDWKEKIKVSFTCSRETALEISGALQFYSDMTPDVDEEREDEDEQINKLRKVKGIIDRASVRNKSI